MEMTLKTARRFALHRQGLLKQTTFGKGLTAVQNTIDQLHYIQIDTISVVDRAHHHILKTRVANYTPDMLHDLLALKRGVFEYWSHAAAYLPIEDYRFYLPIMAGYAKKRPVDTKLKKMILKRIRTEGPLQSRDFEATPGHKSGGWWDWKPAKQAMERMFLGGELMVTERRSFQKVYDLTERVLPASINTATPSDNERGHFYVRRMLGALGIADAREISYAAGTISHLTGFNIRPTIKNAIDELLETGEVREVQIDNMAHFGLNSLIESIPTRLGKKRIRFLSPFDNLVINRQRLVKLFDFDYQLECYVPAQKRRHGYFCLPILYGDQLIGRMDCKVIRKKKILQLNNLWLETDVEASNQLIEDMAKSLNDYRITLQCDLIQIDHISVAGMQLRLSRALKQHA